MKVKSNPLILKWARESLNLSISDVSNKISKSEEIIKQWESGEDFPTYVQLEDLAYNVFKRPLAVFFFPTPPKDLDIKQSFRTLPGGYLESLSPQVIKLLRKANVILINLYDLFDNYNEKIEGFNKLKKVAYQGDLSSVIEMLRNTLQVSIENQFQWKNEDEALSVWRQKVENLGVFVFKDAFRDDNISGFCIYDENFPIIFLNNSMSKTRQIFTLFHELSHLLFQTSGLDFTSEIDFNDFLPSNVDIERKCNSFSGLFLIPDNIIPSIYELSISIKSNVEQYARFLKVSREAIARRLLDSRLITSTTYNEWKDNWSEYKDVEKTASSGNYFNNIGIYLSERYTIEVYKKYYNGSFSISKGAEYLNISEKSFSILESHFIK